MLVALTFLSGVGRAHAATGFDPQDCNQQIAFISPGNGNNYSLTVPASHEYEIVDLSVSFAASATVATRTLTAQVVNGFTVLYLANGVSVTASQSIRVQAVDGAGPGQTGSGTVYVPLPQGLVIPAGYSFQLIAASIQAGDNWIGAVAYCDVASASTQHLVHVDNQPTSMTVNTSPPASLGDVSIASSQCPGSASTTTDTATSTTTVPVTDAPCAVKLAGFGGDGLAIPVAAGIAVFGIVALLVISWRRQRV